MTYQQYLWLLWALFLSQVSKMCCTDTVSHCKKYCLSLWKGVFENPNYDQRLINFLNDKALERKGGFFFLAQDSPILPTLHYPLLLCVLIHMYWGKSICGLFIKIVCFILMFNILSFHFLLKRRKVRGH